MRTHVLAQHRHAVAIKTYSADDKRMGCAVYNDTAVEQLTKILFVSD